MKELKIYIFMIGNLGDTLVTLPALYSIKRKYPDQDVVLICHEKNKGRLCPWDVLEHTKIFSDCMFYQKSASGYLQLIKRVRNEKSKKILFYLKSYNKLGRVIRDFLFLKILCGFNKVFGILESNSEYILRDHLGKLVEVKKEYHRLNELVSQKYLKVAKAATPSTPLLQVPKEAGEVTKDLPQKYIVLGPGSNMSLKQWALKKYIELCDQLLEKYVDVQYLILGSQQESRIASEIQEKSKAQIINLCGKTNVIESAAILQKSLMYIGNDTGTMHLASIMGCPTLAIFSSRDNPGRWEPYGERNRILRKAIDCEGCFLEICNRNNECIGNIAMGEVNEQAQEILTGILNEK